MEDTRSISILNLESGEIYDTDIKMRDDRFARQGFKTYNTGVLQLIDVLTKNEIKLLIDVFSDIKLVDRNNMLLVSFLQITRDMLKSTRSTFKKKLTENNIINDYNNKIMLNPYIFMPRGDKNYKNSIYLIQQSWTYLFEDKDRYFEEVIKYVEMIFDTTLEDVSKYILYIKKKRSIVHN